VNHVLALHKTLSYPLILLRSRLFLVFNSPAILWLYCIQTRTTQIPRLYLGMTALSKNPHDTEPDCCIKFKTPTKCHLSKKLVLRSWNSVLVPDSIEVGVRRNEMNHNSSFTSASEPFIIHSYVTRIVTVPLSMWVRMERGWSQFSRHLACTKCRYHHLVVLVNQYRFWWSDRAFWHTSS
jgi:hypothetical protein